MIITRTPLRISLFGGGTDMSAFYSQGIPGEVLSFTIDKYIYITVNPKFDGRMRVSYSRTENVERPDQIEHDLVRETLTYYHRQGLEITSVSDIPGSGSGLGSSSAFVVGLVRALTNFTIGTLASEAYYIEKERCKHPVGKQDHWAAACGGLRHYMFHQDESVESIEIIDHHEALEKQLLLFYTGLTRKASGILAKQRDNFLSKESVHATGRELTSLTNIVSEKVRDGDLSALGSCLNHAWKLKKKLAEGISDPVIDKFYDQAMEAGAEGGKICGAGGGGFLLFCAPPEKHTDIKWAVGLQHVPFKIVNMGSQVIYDEKENAVH